MGLKWKTSIKSCSDVSALYFWTLTSHRYWCEVSAGPVRSQPNWGHSAVGAMQEKQGKLLLFCKAFTFWSRMFFSEFFIMLGRNLADQCSLCCPAVQFLCCCTCLLCSRDGRWRDPTVPVSHGQPGCSGNNPHLRILEEAWRLGIWWTQELQWLAPTTVVILQGTQEQLPLKEQEDGAHPACQTLPLGMGESIRCYLPLLSPPVQDLRQVNTLLWGGHWPKLSLVLACLYKSPSTYCNKFLAVRQSLWTW